MCGPMRSNYQSVDERDLVFEVSEEEEVVEAEPKRRRRT